MRTVTKPNGGQLFISPDEIYDDVLKAEWENIGEGISGDYNEEDPNDTPLLRFYISVFRDGFWEEMEDASYCTMFDANASDDVREKGLLIIFNRYREKWTTISRVTYLSSTSGRSCRTFP